MTSADPWQRRRVPEIGLSWEAYRPWPVATSLATGCVNIFQRIADIDGLFFIRYGESEVIDEFLATLVDEYTTIKVNRDRRVTVGGWQWGRRIELVQKKESCRAYWIDETGYPDHATVPAMHRLISVTGFEHERTPILVGYRLPEASFKDHRKVLKHTMRSIELSPRQGDAS